MKACVVSLGCPKNLCDSEIIMGRLACAGYQLITNPKNADLIVVNTCAFLKEARDESINTIKTLSKQKKSNAKLYVAGCLPEYNEARGNRDVQSQVSDGIIDSIDIFNSYEPRVKATNPWTAYVKIAEGCNNHCTYCLIPKIRGKLRNRPVNDIILEVTALVKRGVKEIIYVAQDTTAHPGLPSLLKRTSKIKNIRWIRIMYAHPAHISNNLVKAIKNEPKIVKYIDLPLQHICDSILDAMQRRVSGAKIRDLIANLRANIPNLALRTSFIVGFPGEDDKAFDELVNFIKEVKFERLGVFRYSREAGTPAAKMRGQVPEKTKDVRFHKILALQKKISSEMNKKMVGRTVEVLIEKISGNVGLGRTYMDAPEIDCSVKVLDRGCKVGKFVSARVIKASPYLLTAVPSS